MRQTRARTLLLAVAILTGACTHRYPFVRGPAGVPPAPLASVDHRLILIGDAGDAEPKDEPALDALAERVAIAPWRTTVVFLGDNVYETGMPDVTPLEGTKAEEVLDQVLLTLFESRHEAERRLKAQVKAVRVQGARAIFIPGNHDWDQFGVGGWKSILAQQQYIDGIRKSVYGRVDVSFLPRNGCPGPVSVDIGRHARLIVLDTQWWLEIGKKPSPDDPAGCPEVTEAGVLAALGRELDSAAAAGRHAIVAGHHPLASHGPHGGYVDPIAHVFPFTMFGAYAPKFVEYVPLPLLGTGMVLYRQHFSPSGQDFSNHANIHLRTALRDAMTAAATRGAQPLVYAAGHDHSLQLFRSRVGPRWTLVSGLGSSEKTSGVRHDRTTLFAHADHTAPGLMEIDFLDDGSARLAVVEWSASAHHAVEVYSTSLTARPS